MVVAVLLHLDFAWPGGGDGLLVVGEVVVRYALALMISLLLCSTLAPAEEAFNDRVGFSFQPNQIEVGLLGQTQFESFFRLQTGLYNPGDVPLFLTANGGYFLGYGFEVASGYMWGSEHLGFLGGLCLGHWRYRDTGSSGMLTSTTSDVVNEATYLGPKFGVVLFRFVTLSMAVVRETGYRKGTTHYSGFLFSPSSTTQVDERIDQWSVRFSAGGSFWF